MLLIDFWHANLVAFGGILSLSRRIPTIPFGIHEMDSFKLKMRQNVVDWGCTMDFAGGADDAPPDSLVSWGGDTLSYSLKLCLKLGASGTLDWSFSHFEKLPVYDLVICDSDRLSDIWYDMIHKF